MAILGRSLLTVQSHGVADPGRSPRAIGGHSGCCDCAQHDRGGLRIMAGGVRASQGYARSVTSRCSPLGYDGQLGFGVESLLGYVLSSMQNPQDVDGFVIDTEIDAALAVGKRPKSRSYPVAGDAGKSRFGDPHHFIVEIGDEIRCDVGGFGRQVYVKIGQIVEGACARRSACAA